MCVMHRTISQYFSLIKGPEPFYAQFLPYKLQKLIVISLLVSSLFSGVIVLGFGEDGRMIYRCVILFLAIDLSLVIITSVDMAGLG